MARGSPPLIGIPPFYVVTRTMRARRCRESRGYGLNSGFDGSKENFPPALSVSPTMNPKLLSRSVVWSAGSRRAWIALGQLAGLGAALSFLSGCVVAERRHRPVAVVSAPPPTVVVAEPPRVVEKVIIVRESPPPPRREVIVERDRPSPAHVWIAGHWRHDGRVYVWIPGHWDRPPRPRAVWVEPRWERRDGVHVFIEGVWR